MKFKKLNLETWERKAVFQYFINNLRCVMSLTADVDITDFLRTLHKKGYKFYPSMLWVISSAVNSREELRMGYDAQKNPGVWDFVSPYYAHFHKKDGRFVKLVTEYHPDFRIFYDRFLKDRQRCWELREFDLKEIPPNTFDVSCLPWVYYKNFDIHVFDSGTYLAPVITWGKYTEDHNGRIQLPLTMNIHHAAADGFHLCRFCSDVEEWMKRVE